MKILKGIFTNPFAIATASVHWLFLIYSLIFEDTGLFSKTISFHRNDEVYQWLIYLNCLPLLTIETIGNLLQRTIGMNLGLDIILMSFSLFLVNFQWLVIGYFLSKIFGLCKTEETKISIS